MTMKTWLITGASSGFGRALSEYALAQGDRVVGTLRQESQRAEFDALKPGHSFGVLLDVAREEDAKRVVADVETRIGAIDVLVNNAGYGYEGTVEEASMQAVRDQFEVNVFGALRMMQAVLPGMRARRAGHIMNVTSMGGLTTFPGVGIYHGSKFALEGISETLAKEVAGFGILVTAIEPGGFRTDWAGRSLVRGEQTIEDYAPLLGPLRRARAERSGKQLGDPARAAKIIYDIGGAADAPVNLLLGSDAVQFVRAKLTDLQARIDKLEALSVSTDYPK
jgi:NAD(P)-dependent dehydrogenase (short-subunit alcohol dehydrogenase family)